MQRGGAERDHGTRFYRRFLDVVDRFVNLKLELCERYLRIKNFLKRIPAFQPHRRNIKNTNNKSVSAKNPTNSKLEPESRSNCLMNPDKIYERTWDEGDVPLLKSETEKHQMQINAAKLT